MGRTEKKQTKQDRFIGALEEYAFITVAAKRAGIARSTIYRWMEDDKVFATRCNDASRNARIQLNDIAEASLMSRVKDGHVPAIRYWLDNNHFLYRSNRLVLRKIHVGILERFKSYF